MAIWIGPGVLSHKGKDYGYGEELPELGEGVLDRLVEKGKAATEARPMPQQPLADSSPEIKRLADELDAAKKLNSEMSNAITDLTKELDIANETITRMGDEIDEANLLIEALTATAQPVIESPLAEEVHQLFDMPDTVASIEEPAGPKKSKGAKHD